MSDPIVERTGDPAEEASVAADAAENAVKDSATIAKDRAYDAKEAAKDKAREAKETAKAKLDELDWDNVKDALCRGLTDLKNVVLYPLCTGIMTGVGFIAGKRLGERYFYGPDPKFA